MNKNHFYQHVEPLKDQRFTSVRTLVIKVTHRCNTKCDYCYENITSGNDMTLNIASKLVSTVFTSSTSQIITLLLHGGEPTLMSYDWFKSFFEMSTAEAKKANKGVRFSIQTNLINLSKEKLALFKQYNVSLGVSIDNPLSTNGSMRKRSDCVLENIKKVKTAGVKVGLLATINHSNFSEFSLIVNYLADELGVKTFKVNPVYSVGVGINLPSLMPENYFQAYKDIIDYMIHTKGLKLIEKNLSIEIMRFFTYGSAAYDDLRNTLCHEKKCGAGNKVLGITTEGYILPCGRFQWDDISFYLGNVNEVNFDQSAYNSSIENFHNLVPENWYNCSECTAKRVCSFGCQAFISRSKSKANIECLPTQMKFNYFKERERDLKEVYINVQKRLLNVFDEYDDEEEEEKKGKRLSYAHDSKELLSFGNSYSDYSDYSDG